MNSSKKFSVSKFWISFSRIYPAKNMFYTFWLKLCLNKPCFSLNYGEKGFIIIIIIKVCSPLVRRHLF